MSQDNTKPFDIIPISPEPGEIGIAVTEAIQGKNVRAIIIDMRQLAMVVHYEDGSPIELQVNEESVPYLLSNVPIQMESPSSILIAPNKLIEFAKRNGLHPYSFIVNAECEKFNSHGVSVLVSKLVVPDVLILVMGREEGKLSECTMIATNLE